MFDLKTALAHCFADYDEEHPDTWIECGYENGNLYTLCVYSGGSAVFTAYPDADMSKEIETFTFYNVNQEKALELWLKLISGDDMTKLEGDG